jgi:hypothetical protein
MALFHSPRIVTDGLVLYLDAANPKSYPGSGTTWYNLVDGVNSSVSLINNPTYSSNNKGYFTFDGGSQYLSSVTLGGTSGLTAVFFARYQSKGAYHNFFDDENSNRPMLWIQPDDQLELSFNTGVVSTDTYEDAFHIFTAVSSTVSPYMALYVDNLLIGTNTSIAPGIPSETYDLLNRDGGLTYKGDIGAIMFYDKALTADEVAQNFNAIRGRYGI